MKKKLIIAALLVISIFLLAGILWIEKSKEVDKKEESSNNDIVLNTDKDDIQINIDKEGTDTSIQMESEKKSEEKIDQEDIKEDVTDVSSDTTEDSKKEEFKKPKECQHSYDKEIEPSTCTKNGLITYVCTKCNHIYTEVLNAEHAYEKYLCAHCGKIDPQSSPCWAMSAWIHRFGEMNGAGTIYGYPNCESALNVYCHLDLDTIYLSYKDDSTGEHFKVSFHTTDSCFVYYSLDGARGSFTTSNAALSSSMKITFEDFSTSEDNPVDEAEFAEIFASKIDYYMRRIQNEIMSNTGVGLRFFGFNY